MCFLFSGMQPEGSVLTWDIATLREKGRGLTAEPCQDSQHVCLEPACDTDIHITLVKASHVVKPDIREA